MKRLIISLLTVILFSTTLLYAQMDRHRKDGAMKKIEELEKIKLIDALDLKEDIMLKFFHRRTEYRARLDSLFGLMNSQLKKIDETLHEDKSKNDPQIKKMIEEYINLQKKVGTEKEKFINSLTDILTYQQIAKYLVFEQKFREEIRKLLLEHRAKRHWQK